MIMKANIFNIQRFSIHDGPGIRTVVFFKGCPLRCPWCSNPESQHRPTQILWDKKKCFYGHLCEVKCPAGCLNFENNNLVFSADNCTGCKSCITQCPGKALTFVGNMMELDEVMEEVLKDMDFYQESKGGVTLSGGEVLVQPDFAAALLKKCKENGIHTALETTAFSTPLVFSKVLANTDLLLLDIKHYNDREHIKYTGVSNQSILENLDFAVTMKVPVVARIPVIPSVNNTIQDAKEFVKLLKEHRVDTVNLLPFHQFGEKKYEELQVPYQLKDVKAHRPEDMTEYYNVFKNAGLNVSM